MANFRLVWVAVLLLLAGGCATKTTNSTSTHTHPAAYARTGDPVLDGKAAIERAAPRDKVLWQYRTAAAAMRQGRYQEAKELLDDALLTINNIFGKDKDAKRARGYFSEEAKKTFVGEPYERVMANFYRGILYWMDGEPDNARACFKTGQYEDSDAENKSYAQDYVLLDYLDGLATVKLAGDGSDRFQSAQAAAKLAQPPPYDAKANVVVFVEFGHGPTKYASGKYQEELRFHEGRSDARQAVIKVGDQKVIAAAYDDLTYQAMTRGGRIMDHILGNKAVFKSTTGTVGDAALVSAAVVGSQRGGGEAALGLALFGLASKIVSASTTPKADTRCWDNLPQFLGFASLPLAPGDYDATVEFQDAGGNALPALTRTVKLNVQPGPRDTVVFISAYQ